MAIIPQMRLFSWKEIDELGDLDRLRLVLEYMPDIVFQHDSVEKCRREFPRNGQLREMCGFDGQVPSPWAYTRFLKKLIEHEAMVDELFESLVNQLSEVLPEFGKHLAVDSKAIPSFAKHRNKMTPKMGVGTWMRPMSCP